MHSSGLAQKFTYIMESLSWAPSSLPSPCTFQFIGPHLLDPLAQKLRFYLPLSATRFLNCTQIWNQATRRPREKRQLDFLPPSWDFRKEVLIKEEYFLSSVLGAWKPHCCYWALPSSPLRDCLGIKAWENRKNDLWDTPLYLSLRAPFPNRTITRGLLEFSPVLPWCLLCLCSGFGMPWVHEMGYQRKNEKSTASVVVLLILVFSSNLSTIVYISESSNSC